jgi:hypothetical protein
MGQALFLVKLTGDFNAAVLYLFSRGRNLFIV